MVLVAVKLLSVVIAGNAAVDHFADGDAEALRSDGAVLGVVNVIEPAQAPFVLGVAAVLDDRLDDADALFADALSRTPADRSCPVRVNLQLVRERRGDHAGFDRRADEARAHYEAALAVVTEAPPGCFADNQDPDPQRRAVRADAEARLRAKIAAVDDLPLAPPPPPQAPPAPPPPVAVAPDGASGDPDPDVERRLDPRGADPLERLQQILRDSAG
ncbi:hypothetical protein [Mycolicibacterium sp. S2-37]|uniref:hypothetical protein n=1 Tax=Mycolicibacterium sp. S2-37 TaxID=2810297 RepID=UPI001F5E5E80|nr:hypothetical protein [Mycolicibacterium sp. S2-37]